MFELDMMLVKSTDCRNLCKVINVCGCWLMAPSCYISIYKRSKGVTDASLLGLQDARNAFDKRCGLVLQDPCKSEIV